MTPLHHASRAGHGAVVVFLGQHTANDAEAIDKDGQIALHYAVAAGNDTIARCLANCADIDVNG